MDGYWLDSDIFPSKRVEIDFWQSEWVTMNDGSLILRLWMKWCYNNIFFRYLSILVVRGLSDWVLKALEVTDATDSRSESAAAASGDSLRLGGAHALLLLRAASSESDSPA